MPEGDGRRALPASSPALLLLRCWFTIGKPGSPIGELIVVVRQPKHDRVRFDVSHCRGQHAHECRSIAPMLRVEGSRRHCCASVAVQGRERYAVSATDAWNAPHSVMREPTAQRGP
jgi:hypothetical protein